MSSLLRTSGSRSAQKRRSLILRLLLSLFLILFAIFPVIWIISAAINPVASLSTQRLIPENASLDNFRNLMDTYPFLTWWWNSIKISTISTVGSVFITTLAAYAFSRFRFRGRRTMLQTILLIQVFPGMLAMIAIFLLVLEIGYNIPWLGLDTHAGLIMVYLGGAMGINIWLMKGFFDSIPRAIDESAMVDGASHWQIFWILIFPLVRPILVVVAILTFIGTYGDFVLARILLKSQDQITLMVGLFTFTSGQFAQQWGLFAAGALIGALPIMVIYLLLQDYIVGGLTQGAVKG
ncbi:MAG: sugar ABC transporter permease [Candidatus Promineifilaceae bacterium]|nr:sugar ABC transporter permease [Candidatus Promineifilaceae bacterium]